MKTDKITVADLFAKQRRYVVPIFQRGYVWTLQDQLRPLWRDIIEEARFTKAWQQASAHDRMRPVRKHFLGAVVFNQQTSGVRHVPVSEVIDGQQRITTLQILLMALRDVMSPLGDDLLLASLKRLTENEGPHPEENEKYKIWPTNAYQDDITKLASAGSATRVRDLYPIQYYRRKPSPRPLLAQAYLFFWHAVQHYLTDETIYDDTADDIEELLALLIGETTQGTTAAIPATEIKIERAELLLEAITRNFQVVEITLDAEDDAQVIFETLNARGFPLQPSDLIRNFVFLYATRLGENAQALYVRHWQQFDETPALVRRGSETGKFWKDRERQGRLIRGRLDLFLYHYLTMVTGKDLKIEHVFHEFRDWWQGTDTPRVTEEALTELRNFAGAFRQLIEPGFRSTIDIFAYRLKMLDTTTLYPLVLHLWGRRHSLGDIQFEGILTDLEAYLVRRTICGLTPKNYNRIFLQFLNRVRGESDAQVRTALQEEMIRLEGPSVVFPDDETFSRAFLYEPAYKTLPRQRTRMILEALELAQHGQVQEFLPLENPLSKPLSIEHIMPQSPRPNTWPDIPTTAEGEPDTEALLRRERLKHSFGNLTLLTQVLNWETSNGPFSAKRGQIALQSRLSLNTYFQGFQDDFQWDENAVLERGRNLLGLALKQWSYPMAQSTSAAA
jgi:hypothetical protein